MKTTTKESKMCLVNWEKNHKQTAAELYNKIVQKFTLLHFTKGCWKSGRAGALSCSVAAAGFGRGFIGLDVIDDWIFVMPLLLLVALFLLLLVLSMLMQGHRRQLCFTVLRWGEGRNHGCLCNGTFRLRLSPQIPFDNGCNTSLCRLTKIKLEISTVTVLQFVDQPRHPSTVSSKSPQDEHAW